MIVTGLEPAIDGICLVRELPEVLPSELMRLSKTTGNSL
jgi:hypothetical protein